jgi:hypothetical protein
MVDPTIGTVYACNYKHSGRQSRYIILDAAREPSITSEYWRLRLVSVESHQIIDHEFKVEANDDQFVTLEPLADGEEVLFFQAMLVPHTLKDQRP